MGNGITLTKQSTIDIWEIRGDFVGLLLAQILVIGGKDNKDSVNKIGEVGTIDGGVVFNGFGELVLYEKPCVLGEETEKKSRHEDVDIV